MTLAVGPSSKNRIQGDLTDIAETIYVSANPGAASTLVSISSAAAQNNEQHFDNVTSIIGNFGAGDDFIDLSGLTERHHGPHPRRRRQRHAHRPEELGVRPERPFCASLFGDGGDDTLKSSSKNNDLLDGGDGNDTLYGSNGGNAGASTLRGGRRQRLAPRRHRPPRPSTAARGDDTIDGGGGADQYIGVNSASIVTITTTRPGHRHARPERPHRGAAHHAEGREDPRRLGRAHHGSGSPFIDRQSTTTCTRSASPTSAR